MDFQIDKRLLLAFLVAIVAAFSIQLALHSASSNPDLKAREKNERIVPVNIEKERVVKDEIQSQMKNAKESANMAYDQSKDYMKEKKDEVLNKASDWKDDISDKAYDIKEKVKDKLGEWKDKATEVKDETMDKASELKEDLKEKGQEWKEQAMDKTTELKDSLKEQGSELKDQVMDKANDLSYKTREMKENAKDWMDETSENIKYRENAYPNRDLNTEYSENYIKTTNVPVVELKQGENIIEKPLHETEKVPYTEKQQDDHTLKGWINEKIDQIKQNAKPLP